MSESYQFDVDQLQGSIRTVQIYTQEEITAQIASQARVYRGAARLLVAKPDDDRAFPLSWRDILTDTFDAWPEWADLGASKAGFEVYTDKITTQIAAMDVDRLRGAVGLDFDLAVLRQKYPGQISTKVFAGATLLPFYTPEVEAHVRQRGECAAIPVTFPFEGIMLDDDEVS